MDEIESTNRKGKDNFFHSTQKDMDKNIQSMQELQKLIKEVQSEMNNVKKGKIESGDLWDASRLSRDVQQLNKDLDKSRTIFQKTADNRTNMSSLNRSIIKDQQAYNDELDDSTKRLEKLTRLRRDYGRLESRSKSRATAASSAGNMTYQQAQTFKKEHRQANNDIPDMLSRNQEQRESLRSQLKKDYADLANLNKDTSMNDHDRNNMASALKENIKNRYAEIEALKKLDSQMKQTLGSINQSAESMDGVRVSADRKSTKGILSSRAPSITMAALGSFMAVGASLNQRGATANSAMREPSISIGQRTGNYDFRSLKRELQSAGTDRSLGYKGADMLDFQNTVLSNTGFTSREDLTGSTEAMAKGTRAVPVDRESLDSFMAGAMQNGSISGADQIKSVQKGFLGAIKQSGMEGREKDQLSALEALSNQSFSGRNGSNEDLNNLMAIQAMMASSGDRSMQGSAGAQALSGLDAGIKGAMDDPTMKMLFGGGTKYLGMSGRWEEREQLAKGIADPENLQTLFESSKTYSGGTEGGQKEAFTLLAKKLNADLTPDEVNAMFKATNGGKDLSQENLSKAREVAQQTGSEQYDKNAKGYSDSKEATANASEAVTESQASRFNENPINDAIKKVNSALGGLPMPLYALGAAVIATTGAMLTSMGMSLGSSVLQKATTSTFSAGGAAAGATGATAAAGTGGTVGGAFKASGGFKNFKGAFKAGASSAKETVQLAGMYGKDAFASGGVPGVAKEGGKGVMNWAKNLGSASKGATGGATAAAGGATAGAVKESAGLLGKFSKGMGAVGKVASKALVPLAIGMSIFNVAKAKKGEKAEVAGSEAGGWGGALAGGAAGTAILPGIGTVIGAGVGAFAGSKAGGWLGDKIGGAWGSLTGKGKTAEASEMSGAEKASIIEPLDKKKGQGLVGAQKALSEENKAKDKEEKDTSNKKILAEKKREANNMAESSNLSLYSKLLDRAQAILIQAKAQNGIFGNGKGTGGSGGGTAGSGQLDYLGDGKKWSNENITQHDLGKTVAGLTAEELDAWISQVAPEGSSMRGLGSTFLEAGKQSGLDPRYLVSHAALETGWGGGYSNGDPNKGNWFGIGAFDSDPDNAKKYGDGVIGGAKWIADNYYSQGQTTLDSMRNNGGNHEYATDPDWDKKIASIMKGSEKYTAGKSQNIETKATINVNVNGRSGDVNKEVGKAVGQATKASFSEQLNFFTKEMARL